MLASTTPKYSEVNLIKVHVISTQKNFKISLKEIKNLNEWRGIPHSRIEKFYIVNM